MCILWTVSGFCVTHVVFSYSHMHMMTLHYSASSVFIVDWLCFTAKLTNKKTGTSKGLYVDPLTTVSELNGEMVVRMHLKEDGFMLCEATLGTWT